MPRPSSSWSRRSPNIAALRARRALVAAGRGLRSCSSPSMTALVIGAVLGLGHRMSPFCAGLLVGVLLAAGGYLPGQLRLGRHQGAGRDKAEQQAIDKGEAP